MNPREAKQIQKINSKELFLPRKIELAISLIYAFIKNNNVIGLKLAILISGAKDKIEYSKDNEITFNVDELCSEINVEKRQLSTAKKKIIDTTFEYVLADGSTGITKPLHTIEYSADKKTIKIGVSHRAKELFTELGRNSFQFTKAISKNLMLLKHKHSLRMQLFLEMINNYDDNYGKRKRMTLEDINGYFGVNYENFYELERKILKPVKEEITLTNKLTFTYKFETELNKGTGRPKFEYVVIDLVNNSNSLFAQ